LSTVARASGNINISSSKPIGPWWRVRTALLGYWLAEHRLAPRRLTYAMTRLWLPVSHRFTGGP
jgi:hypothetical protein